VRSIGRKRIGRGIGRGSAGGPPWQLLRESSNPELPPDIRQLEREPDRFESLVDQGAVEEGDQVREERGGRPSGRITRAGLIGAGSRAKSESGALRPRRGRAEEEQQVYGSS
jgi:hypothetical protein